MVSTVAQRYDWHRQRLVHPEEMNPMFDLGSMGEKLIRRLILRLSRFRRWLQVALWLLVGLLLGLATATQLAGPHFGHHFFHHHDTHFEDD